MSGPLAGVKVLEIAQVYAVPAAASLLGDMGAEVVKIEPPWGDSTRYGRPLLSGEGRNFIGLNHGKRTMCVDIARPESRSVIEALIRQADVILINLRIDHVPAFKLTYDDCRAIRPDIIYLVNTAAGPLGPLSGLGGYDMTIAALAGIGASQGYMRGDQLVNGNGVAITDAGTSFLMVAAVSSALYHRLKTGEGQMIETSNLSTALNCQLQSLNSFAVDSETEAAFQQELTRLRNERAGFPAFQATRARILGRGAAGGSVYYRFYRTKDSYISIGAISPHLAARTRKAVGVEDPRQRPGFDISNDQDRKAFDQFTADVEAAFASRTTAQWIEILTTSGVPHGAVNFPEEALNDPQVIANDYVTEVEHPLIGSYRTPAPPIKMSRTSVTIRDAAPFLDQHTDEVLVELGFSESAIALLRESGAVGRAVELPADYH